MTASVTMLTGQIEDQYPLSPLQQGLLFHTLESTAAGMYLDQLGFYLTDIDPEVFQEAWTRVIARHTILRTSFHWEDVPSPVQRVHRNVQMPVEWMDWRGMSEIDRHMRLKEFQLAQRTLEFDIARPPVMRVAVIRVDTSRYYCHWTWHHLISDGWSSQKAVQDFVLIYQAILAGHHVELPASRPYRDFIDWLGAQKPEKADAYWRKLLAGFSEPTSLATKTVEASRRRLASDQQQEYEVILDAQFKDELTKAARQHRFTLSTIVQGAWSLVLNRHSGGSNDVVFGSVVSGRPPELPGVESIVGLFINTIPIRAKIKNQEPLLKHLQRLQNQLAASRQYEFTPLVKIKASSDVSRQEPLFESIVAFENYPGSRLGGGEASSSAAERFDRISYPLALVVVPGNPFVIHLSYDPQSYSSELIARLARDLKLILQRFVQAPNLSVQQCLAPTTEEQARIAKQWNGAAREVPCASLTAQVEGVCRDRGGAIAVGDGEAELTYSDLVEQARRIGRGLRGAGLGREEMVGVLGERSARYPGMLLGVWKGGGAYLALDPEGPAARTVGLLRQSGCRVVLSEESCRGMVQQLREGLEGLQVVWREELEREAEGEGDEGQEDKGPEEEFGEQLAYMFYTSGSTGVPKGALVEHAGVRNHVWAKVETLGLSSRDVVAQNASQSFDVSVWQMMSPFVVGGRVEVIAGTSARDGGRLLEAVAERAVTVLEVVPSQLRAMVAEDEITEIPSLRWLYVMGEVFEPALYAEWRRRYPHVGVVNGYGATECSDDVAQRTLGEEQGERLPIGRPLSNLQVYVATEDGDLARPAEVGEIYIGGVGVGRGYRGEASRTALRFVPDGWSGASGGRLYRTGDRGMWNEGGELEFVGRVDEQVKVRGHRVEPGEVEAALRSLAGVREAAVVVREERLVAFVEGDEVDSEQVRKQLRDRLPEYLIPAMVVQLAELPRTAGGKLDRPRLPATVEVERQIAEVENPQTATEELLAGIWAEVLGIGSVGRHDNFFELGGDSILTIQIAARARQQGIQLNPRHIFDYPTVARLASVADNFKQIDIRQASARGSAPLTPIQQWFFERDPKSWNHYNMSIVLEVPEKVDAAILTRSVAHLLDHHDQLRAYFTHSDSGWQQAIAPRIDPEVDFLLLRDLSNLTLNEQTHAIEQEAAVLQSNFDLSSPPLIRLAYFNCGQDQPGRLLFIVHHLIVDAVSMSFLLEDLRTAYEQMTTEEPVVLPPKTTSFQAWAEKLVAESTTLAKREAGLWRGEMERALSCTRLPKCFPDGTNVVASSRSVFSNLDRATTRLLLQKVPQVYGANIADALLSALGRSLARWTKNSRISIDVEGHGREPLFQGIDLSRTVGWFTTIAPLTFDASPESTLQQILIEVKERRNRQPHRGLGYGVLQYLFPDEDLKQSLRPHIPQEVSFNYLGQSDRLIRDTGSFRISQEKSGPDFSPNSLRSHLLAVSAHVSDGMLSLEWNYSNACHRSEVIEMLAADCEEELRAIAELCQRAPGPVRTPSDFPFVSLDERSLERIIANYGSIEDILPVGPLHEGMLFESLSRQDASVYIEQFTFTLTSRDIGPASIESAWQQVLNRHSTLRAAFALEDLEHALMVIKPHVLLPVAFQDWRDLEPAVRENKWEHFLHGDRERGFHTNKAPLMRLSIIQSGEYEYRVVWSFHHLLVDGWSASILLNEVFALLSAAQRGQTINLPQAPSYQEYASWLNHQETGTTEKFWRRQLAGFTDPTPVPFSSSGSARREKFDAVTRTISEETASKLRSFAARHKLTLNTLIQGAYAYLISEHSGKSDVVFGATVAGRPEEVFQIEKMVGLFINTLPRRVNVRREQNLIAWLAAIQQGQVELMAHQHVSLAQVQTWSEVPRGVRLFDSLVNFANYPIEQELIRNAEFIGIEQSELHGFTEYAITLTIAAGRNLQLALKFDCARLDEAGAAEILEQLCAVVTAMPAKETGYLSDLELVSKESSLEKLGAWISSEGLPAPSACVHELFEQQVQRTPHATALVFGQQQLTYSELNRRANRLAHILLSRKGNASIVNLHFDRGLDMIVAALAVLKSGAAYQVLDYESPEQQRLQLLQSSGLSLILTRRELKQLKLPDKAAVSILFIDQEDDETKGSRDENLNLQITGQSLMSILHTSAASRKQKGVMVEHRQFANYLTWAARVFNFDNGTHVLAHSPFGVSTAASMTFAALIIGGCVEILPGHRGTEALSDMKFQSRSVALTLTRPQLELLQIQGIFSQLSSWRGTLVLTGDEVEGSLLKSLRDHAPGLRIFNEFRIAETAGGCCVHEAKPDDVQGDAVVIGRPMAGMQAYVLSSSGEIAPPGVEGDLYIGGAQISRGYLNDVRATAEYYRPDPFSGSGNRLYATGDRARRLPDGRLEYRGRKDEQGSLDVFHRKCKDIESVLRRHKDVVQCAVEVTTKPEGPAIAYVVPRPGSQLNVRELRRHLMAHLPGHAVVSNFIRLESLPLSLDGTVDRAALRVHANWEDGGQESGEPVTDWEIRLAAIWRDLFKIDHVRIDQDFFELGGHSLLALRMVTRIRHEFGIQLALTTLAESRTIRHTAAVLARGHVTSSHDPLVPIQPKGSKPPFYCIHPIGGSVFRFFELSRCLGPDQPFFGVQAPDLLQAIPNKTIEEYASEYREAIVKGNPDGPYLIGGYSFGGAVAFELAQQLVREGRQVALLALLDTHSPYEQRKIPDPDDPLLVSILVQSHARMDGDHVNLQAGDIAVHEQHEQMAFVFRQLKRAGIFDADIPDEMGADYLENALNGYKARSRAARNYYPTPFPGRIVLFKSEEMEPGTRDLATRFGLDLDDETCGWRKLSSEQVVVHIVPGVHERLCHQPNVRVLAARLAESITAGCGKADRVHT
jgi:amino acid adenylation domain-containing protein/non-ribosomal peptide synthase protein (TIGR01720 family)